MAVPTPTFTVFTPSYNRAALLPRLYESLRAQSYRDFEWVVVDDGSTDDTRQCVCAWAATSPFPIRYIWKSNGGKHTAINVGVREARGTWFASIDSDDRYVPNALERMLHHCQSLPPAGASRFSGICGLLTYDSGEIVGTRFPQDVLDVDCIDLWLNYPVDGDKLGVTRTSVMAEFPFPEDLGRFVPEGIVWNRMGQKYLTRFVNEVFAIAEYQPGGLTDRARVLNAQHSKASLTYNYELLTAGKKLPPRVALRTYSNYIRHSLNERISFSVQFRNAPLKSLFLGCYPLGVYLYARDRRVLREAASS